MKAETYERNKKDGAYSSAIWFIDHLIKKGIPLEAIDTNDFSCNLNPGIYIHNRLNLSRCRIYHRWNARTLKLALNWYHEKAKRPYTLVY